MVAAIEMLTATTAEEIYALSVGYLHAAISNITLPTIAAQVVEMSWSPTLLYYLTC